MKKILFREWLPDAQKFNIWGFEGKEFTSPVCPDAKMQMRCIGFKDKNGNDIFELDVKRDTIEYDEGDQIEYYACVWIKEWSMFGWLNLPGELQSYLDQGAESLDSTMFWTYNCEHENYEIAGNLIQHFKKFDVNESDVKDLIGRA